MTPPRPCAPQLVLFDNDGVLVDSETHANRELAALLTELGVPTTYEESLRDYLGGSLARVREMVTERHGAELPGDFDDRYHDRVFAAFRTGLDAVAGVPEVLAELAAAGVPVCVASSGSHERIRLTHTLAGLRAMFPDEVLFSAQDVVRGKPAPDLFLHAAATLGADPARCVVVEDSPLGVAAARAAGMRVLGYAATTPADRLAGAHAVITDMAELPGLLLGGERLPAR